MSWRHWIKLLLLIRRHLFWKRERGHTGRNKMCAALITVNAVLLKKKGLQIAHLDWPWSVCGITLMCVHTIFFRWRKLMSSFGGVQFRVDPRRVWFCYSFCLSAQFMEGVNEYWKSLFYRRKRSRLHFSKRINLSLRYAEAQSIRPSVKHLKCRKKLTLEKELI